MGARAGVAASVRLFVAVGLVALVPVAANPAAGDETAAVRRALRYLLEQQLTEPLNVPVGLGRVVDLPGDWPQFFRLRDIPGDPVRDVSPFMPAFIHHALTLVVEENRRPLRLSARDLRDARLMRQRAIWFVRLFESPAGEPDAGTFGFWPYDVYPGVPGPILTQVLVSWLGGPILGGKRVPANLPIFPDPLAIPSDADVTATTYAALMDDAALDGGPGTVVAFERFFADWRDVGLVPRRLNPPWLPPASGAFLTWLSYQQPGSPIYPNDIDLVVNANVLYALGRIGRLDTPGVADSIRLINQAVALRLHRDRFDEIAEYYPDNLMFQYAVSRAFHEGGVAALGPAIEILADELEASAIERADGTAYWDRGSPQLNTAFAVLTLLNAGRDTSLVGRATAYLAAAQDSPAGFEDGTFFIGAADNGQVFEFFSRSFTAAMVLEAMARYALRD